jgi:hypothetical protein
VLPDIRGADRDGPGRAENLKEFVDAGQLRKLGEQFFFVDKRKKTPFLEGTHSSGGGFFKRLIDIVAKIPGREDVQNHGKRNQDHRQRASVPERQPDT